MNTLIIDTYTEGHRKIFEYLEGLDSTLSILDGGEYRHAPECSQLGLYTELTKEQIEKLLWTGNYKYVGVMEDDDNRYGFLEEIEC
jgi:hypothetical protein